MLVILITDIYTSTGQTNYDLISKKTKFAILDTSMNDSTVVLDYAFKDSLDMDIRLSKFRGKYVIVDLWYSGCGFCVSANNGLKIVHDSLKNKNIVFLSISVDKDKREWIQSITEGASKSKLHEWAGMYVPAKGTITLYTGGSHENNDFIRKYVPMRAYPKLLFIDPNGRIISTDPPRPDRNPGKLITFLKHYLEDNIK